MNRRHFLTTAGSVLMAMATGGSAATTPRQYGPLPLPPPDPEGAPLVLAPTEAPPDPVTDRPFRVAMLSDVHLQPEGSALSRTVNVKLARAVAELKRFKPDLWVTNGDIADHGEARELELFKNIMSRVAKPDRVLVTTGNHEFYDMATTDDVSLRRFTRAFGGDHPYSSKVYGNVHFVMLADEQWKTAPYNKDWCWLTPEQLRWFARVLADHREKLTAVFMHQPLNETVLASQGPDAFGGANAAQELYDILRQNPQVKLWFSGHTHRRLDLEGQVVQKAHTTFVALGSTIYLLSPADQAGGGLKQDAAGSQSRVMDIYPDKVVIATRDHAAGDWLHDLTIAVQRT